MNQLTKSNNLTMTSVNISELTGKRHSDVMRDIRVIQDQLDTRKFAVMSHYMDNSNRKRDMWILDYTETMTLLTGYSVVMRVKVIDRWQQLEDAQKPQLPQSFAEALQLAANQAKLLEEAAPKVEFHDKLVNDNANFSIRDAAKKIQQRPNKFSAWLRQVGYLCQNNLPKQQYINQGLFKTHTGTSKEEFQFSQTRVTSKGLSYFTSKLTGIKL